MRLFLKILLVCACVVVGLHIIALVGVFTYNRMKDGNTPQPATPHSAKPSEIITYVVKRGETLSMIAARNESTLEAIATLNDLRDVNQIAEGQTLKIPGKG
jgi:LysM repeat protein